MKQDDWGRTARPGSSGLLRAWVPVLLITGAAGSEALMLRAGHRNRSVVLLVLFTGWVLMPFAALLWAHLASRRWPARGQSMLTIAMFITIIGSLGIYAGVAFGRPIAKPAAPFLMVPLASMFLIALVTARAMFASRRQSS